MMQTLEGKLWFMIVLPFNVQLELPKCQLCSLLGFGHTLNLRKTECVLFLQEWHLKSALNYSFEYDASCCCKHNTINQMTGVVLGETFSRACCRK